MNESAGNADKCAKPKGQDSPSDVERPSKKALLKDDQRHPHQEEDPDPEKRRQASPENQSPEGAPEGLHDGDQTDLSAAVEVCGGPHRDVSSQTTKSGYEDQSKCKVSTAADKFKLQVDDCPEERRCLDDEFFDDKQYKPTSPADVIRQRERSSDKMKEANATFLRPPEGPESPRMMRQRRKSPVTVQEWVASLPLPHVLQRQSMLNRAQEDRETDENSKKGEW